MAEVIERRHTEPNRSAVAASRRSDGKQVIAGYGAVFWNSTKPGTQYRLSDNMVERIRPTAFHRAISEAHNARALYNHDSASLLGTVASGTCRLSVDLRGLKYEIAIDPADPDHHRVLAKIKRGDLTGSSFAFRPTKISWGKDGSDDVRWIEDLELFDVGPVTYPAYGGATTGLRSEELDALRDECSKYPALKLRLAQLKLAKQQMKANRDSDWIASL